MNKLLIVVSFVLTNWLSAASVEIDIVITEGMNFARPIAVVPFQYKGVAKEPPHNITSVIAADLRRSGRFNPIAYTEMPEQPISYQEVNLAAWKSLGVEAVVVGQVEEQVAGQYVVTYQLIDVFRQVSNSGNIVAADSLLLNRQGSTTRQSFRFYTHQIADTIYEALTGEKGAFATRIAYVVVDRSQTKAHQLFIADSDGFNPQRLYASEEPIMSPTWSPDGRSLAYSSFENGKSEIYLQQIYTGKRDMIAAFPGINGAPEFSPDGKKIALTLSMHGNSEIYVLNLETRKFRRLTTSPFSIETEPTWSPAGDHILYTSDQSGRPQIYKVSINGGKSQRITFDGEYNASANYTPDGKSIILVNRTNGVFHIAIQDVDTGIMQVLTDTRLDESPSLAPNGSMVIYATIHNGRQVLAAVSTDGRFKARLPSSVGEVKAPAWSPFLLQ
ncbi:MAG: Tol-Pal system beta propeller repeat protein TolB [Kangiellaceae bacterium]|jgi:TolB protein|nr:Tol-Pal system beta propeller repeat protein TolB [Kangiellaceae bacterium]